MSKNFGYIILHVLVFFIVSCNGMEGEYPLGNHLSLWDNDKEKTAIIVYCEGDCHGGIQVLPIRERQTNSGEYVEEAISNKKWVIAKTFQIKENKENYYIISKEFNIENLDCAKANCDSILQSHVTGPMTLTEFENKKKSMNIALDLNKHL
jgi:hypothetical protein